MRILVALLLAGALVSTSCSTPSETRSSPRARDDAERSTADRSAPSESKAARKANRDRNNQGRDPKAGEAVPPGGDTGATTPAEDGDSGKEAQGSENGAMDGARPAQIRRPAPRSGRFRYAQSGWEEFCAGPCRRHDLPPAHTVDASVARVGSGKLRVVTESKSSEDRSVRTTSLLSSGALEVTEVVLRYGTMSERYEPDPPVRSLRLPLTVGDTWSSSWTADTSGRLDVRVLGKDSLQVDGRRVETFRLDTVTTLRGDFRGTLTSIVWVDPDTATTVRTSGRARLRTDYGRFSSNFETMLLEGPGY